MSNRKDWSPTNGEGWGPGKALHFEGTFGGVRFWSGRALTAEEIRSVYDHVGHDGIHEGGRVIRPHAHKCPTCHFLWYCEKEDIPEHYIPAVPSDGWPTTPDGHDCAAYQEPIEWFAKGRNE